MTHRHALVVQVICLVWLLPVTSVTSGAQQAPTNVQSLYRQLRSVELDPNQVFKIRDASIDREDLHLYLNDGIIGFTHAVDGKITGAFFEGDGQVLMRPPNQSERTSLGLFTDSGVLNEQFDSAYLRFNDNTAKELESSLRPLDEGAAEFLAKNEVAAHDLAVMDALRLVSSFTSSYPQDRFLHARLLGEHLGSFDVFYDSMAEEQIGVGKFVTNEYGSFYDIWMAFAGRSVRSTKNESARVIDPWRSSYAIPVTKFVISAKLLPPQTIEAQADLTMQVKKGGQRVLFFELSRYLKLQKITLNGQPLDFLQNESLDGTQLAKRGNDLFLVILPQALRDGETLQLHFEYAGNVMSQAGEGLLYVGARGTWYPNRGISMSNFDLQFEWPSQWTLVATGKRVSLDQKGNDIVGRWVSEVPMPLAGFNLGQYTKKSLQDGKVTVESYAANTVEYSLQQRSQQQAVVERPPVPFTGSDETAVVAPPLNMNPAQRGQTVAERCAKAIDNYTRWFGPYPYSSLAVTQFPGGDSQGWPGLIFLSSVAFLSPEEQARLKLDPYSRVLYGDLMPWHETAHMWWGDVVFWRTYRDQWLVEALSNYSALMIIEREDPQAFRTAMERYRSDLLSKAPNGHLYLEAGPVDLGVRLSSSKFPGGYAAISYGRGTWLLHMLRAMLKDTSKDDAVFLGALRQLRERFAFREANIEDLQKIFEDVLPTSLKYEGRRSLDWFFEGWINGTAIPTVSLSDVKITTRGEQPLATFTLQQKDAPRDLVTSVPIYAQVGEQRVYVARVFADGDTSKHSLRVPAGTKRLLLDPENTVLRRP